MSKQELTVMPDISLAKMVGKKTSLPAVLLFYIKRGYARVEQDESLIIWEKNHLACIMPAHTVEILECSPDFNATAVVMSKVFLNELKKNSFSHDYQKYAFAPVFPLQEEQATALADIIRTVQTICSIQPVESPFRHELLVSQIVIAHELLHVFQYRQGIKPQWTNRDSDIFNQFCELLATHFRESREVRFYADLLFLSPKYFSNVIRQTTNMSASRWIDDYVAAQAKRILLTRTDITIQEIGYRLGFPEPASFIHFFKRTTGLTPKEFRNSKKKL